MKATKVDCEVYVNSKNYAFTFTVESCSPSVPPSWDDPGDGAEVELSNVVTYDTGEEWCTDHVTTYDVAILSLASDLGISIADAEALVYQEACARGEQAVYDAWEAARDAYYDHLIDEARGK